MDFFKAARGRDSGYTVVIGCGRLGASLANAISDKEASVMMVDRDEHAFRKLGSAYGGLTMTGDATDIAVLRSAEIERADTVVSVTNDDNTNIMVAQIARNVYHIPNVICRLYDPEREIVYKEFDIDTICPTVLSTREIDRLLDRAKGEKEA
ncbi:MAG: TrkA family potassium uptake protein [Clostridiales bacterium]|nr:TrkA family potassium uptake protein [Clostridiales bacterium]